MTNEIFNISKFKFPYTDIRFPGQNTEEKILFITRESEIVEKLKIVISGVVIMLGLTLSLLLLSLLEKYLPVVGMFNMVLIGLAILIYAFCFWWISQTYKKSIFIITTRRLTKLIHPTPFTWYQFSLGLDEIQDTGSYGSSYLEAIFGLGYFVARSGAGNIKNFKIINIKYAADLHNYVNKLLFAFKHHPDKIGEFRPFIPELKGEDREKLLQQYPEYKTDFS